MDLVNACRLPAAPVRWQPRAGVSCLTIVCKATFVLGPQKAKLAFKQEALHESDLAPAKPRADVVLVGHAFAPGPTPVRSLVARLRVDDFDKSVEVISDRAFSREGVLREGAPFLKMPLAYERAAGGPDTWNPVGVRHEWTPQGTLTLPNLLRPGTRVSASPDAIEPVGFGPIGPSWPMRRARLGRHGALASGHAWQAQPLPEDFDLAFFNVAPPDQQVATLDDKARLFLEHLHPEWAHLTTALPGVRPRAAIAGRGNVPLRCDTLWIDTDRGLATLTWRGPIRLDHADEPGRVTVTLEPEELHPDDVEPPEELAKAADARGDAPPRQAMDLDAKRTIPASAAVKKPVLPFGATTQVLPQEAILGLGISPAPQSPAAPPAERSPSRSSSSPPIPLSPVFMVPPAASPAPAAPSAEASRATPLPPIPLSPVFMPPPAAPSPGPPPLVHASGAAGVLEASNAAAGATPAVEEVKSRSTPPPKLEPARPAAGLEDGEALLLLWYSPESVPRIRRRALWKSILDVMEEQPVDPELDDPELSPTPTEVENRRDLAAILTQGEPSSPEALLDALAGGIRRRTLTPQVALVAGELVFPFDESGILRALVAAVTPIGSEDEKLRPLLKAANDFLSTAGGVSVPAMAEGLAARIKEAFRQGRRALSAEVLEAQVERAALEHRSYQRRTVLGGAHLRALLVGGPGGAGQAGVPAYLPERLAPELPMYQRFKVRALAEVHPPVDQHETSAVALRVVALGRVCAVRR